MASRRPTTAGGPSVFEPSTNIFLLDSIQEKPDDNPFAFGPPQTAQEDEQPESEYSPHRQVTAASYMPAPPWSAAPYLNYSVPMTSQGLPRSAQFSAAGAESTTTGSPSSADGLFSTTGSYKTYTATDSRAAGEDMGGLRRRKKERKERRALQDWVEKVGADITGIISRPSTRHKSSSSIASIKVEMDLEVFDDEDSPYPEVRASVSNTDDPDMPSMTIRMWVIGVLLCYPLSAANVFFNLRFPTVGFSAYIPLLLCYPLGKFAASVLPITTYRVWLPRPFSPFTFTLNPGPWSIKEHTLVFILSNACISPSYSFVASTVLRTKFDFQPGFWFDFLFGIALQMTGFAFAGLCRRIFVTPAVMIWPQILGSCVLLNTLHAEDDSNTGEMTRYRYFTIIATGSFFFYFLPGFLFQALSVFSFICWIVPDNVVVNQLFGANSGLGMNFLTFDWGQIAYVNDPFATPWWAEVHVFSGFVFFYWILLCTLYYTNVWKFAHFPILGFSVYDRFGAPYQYRRILTPDRKFNETAYNEYSPLYISAVFAITYLIAFATLTNVIVHTILYHSKTLLAIWREGKSEDEDIHAKLMNTYPNVPQWWYAALLVFCFVLQIIVTEVWHLGVPIWMLALTLLIPTIYFIPSVFILAQTTQSIPSVNLPLQLLSGGLFPGKPVVTVICKAYGAQALHIGSGFLANFKLGHYMKIPPRSTFTTQVVGVVIAMFIHSAVQQAIFASVEDICTPQAAGQLVCPQASAYATASIIWGVIGPSRLFGPGARYRPELFAILVGAILPFPFWLWQRRHPRSLVRYISTPIFLSVAYWIPPATGINYTSTLIVSFVFQYLIRKKYFTWWLKYNYMTSVGLDIGTSISIIIIFFAFVMRTNPIQLDWWGNNVYLNTADFLGLPFRPIPSDRPLPWSTSS